MICISKCIFYFTIFLSLFSIFHIFQLRYTLGIQVGNVSLQDRSLHVQPNDIRGLKTKGFQRVIPLSDTSVEALQQRRQGKDDGDPVFPRYALTNGNTSLSAMMMKHFRKAITDPKKSLHSLRHRMKDALRNTGCGDELGKSILGHTTAGVSARYGSGHSIAVADLGGKAVTRYFCGSIKKERKK